MPVSSITKILAYSAAIVSVAAAVVTIFDFWDRISAIFERNGTHFEAEEVCTWDKCLKNNRRFIEFVQNNVGKAVTVNVLLDITTGAGDFQSQCYDDLILASDWGSELDGYNAIAILPNFESCKPEGRILISYRETDKLEAQAVTGSVQDRLYGDFIITLRQWGGPALFEFQKI